MGQSRRELAKSGQPLTKAQLLLAIARGELLFESFDRRYETFSVHLNTAAAVSD